MNEQCEPLRIGIDFDGVLFDTDWLKMSMACVFFPSKYRDRLALDQHSDLLQLTPEEDEYIETILYSNENSNDGWIQGWAAHWQELVIIPGVRTYVPLLSAERNLLYVVTKRGRMGVQAARILIQQWEIGGLEGVVGVGPDKSKNFAAAILGLDVMIDDSPAVLEEMDGIVPHRLLLDQPYNHGTVLSEGITRLPDWSAIYRYVGSIAA